MEQRIAVLIGILAAKMDLVKVQRAKLEGILAVYVDKVTEAAHEAIKAEDQDVATIKELSSKMEAAFGLLLGLSMELEPNTPVPTANISDSSEVQVLPSTSTLVKSTSPSAAYTQHHQLHNSESAEMIKLQNRMEAVEAAIATCRNEASHNAAQYGNEIEENKTLYKTFGERLDNYEKQISEMYEKQSTAYDEVAEKVKRIEAQNNTQEERLKTTELEIEQIEKGRTSREKEENMRSSDFDDNIKQLHEDIAEKTMDQESGAVNEMQKKMNQLAEAQEKQDERIEKLYNELNQLQSQNADLKKRVNSKKEAMGKRITKLENTVANDQSQLHKLSEDFETMNTQYCIKQHSSRLNNVEHQVERLTSHLTVVEANAQENTKQLKGTSAEIFSKMDLIASKEDLCDVLKMSNTLSRSVDGLTSKIAATESFVKDSVSYREKMENKRRELEDRILVVENNRSKDLEHYAKNLEEVESQYKQVCQIVDNRVTPLRRLQRMLHEYHQSVEKREELSARLDETMEQMKNITSKVDDLVTRGQHIGVGFTAYFPRITIVKQGAVVTDFSDVRFNNGSHYNPTTGIFTAPSDGVYITSVVLRQEKEGSVDVHILRSGTLVCKAVTYTDKTVSCGFAAMNLVAGETLHVEVVSCTKGVKLSNYSSFSCVRVA